MGTDRESTFQEEGYNLMGAAFEVYDELGSGLLEEIYQLFNYMKMTNTKVVYLLNFGHKEELEWKRYIL